jgi:hypothetical protein
MLVAGDEAWKHWHTAQDIACQAEVKTGLDPAAACSVVKHWNSVALHDGLWRDIDRLKGTEKYQGHLHVTLLAGLHPSGTQRAVKEQLWPCKPQQALAADVHIPPSVEIFRLVGIVGIGRNQADTILPTWVM